MKVNLYINYYVDSHHHRKQELDECLVNNVLNKEIDNLYIVLDKAHIPYFEKLIKHTIANTMFGSDKYYRDKIRLITTQSRPTYNDYFSLTKNYSKEDDISIIANTDIMFDEKSLSVLRNWHWNGSFCMALCRWDMIKKESTEESVFFNRPDSQDVWIVKGGFKLIPSIDFGLGVAGCDNKIAHLLSEHYQVINPSLEIKTYHLHLTGVRNYINFSQVERLPPPYLQIAPSMLPK